MTYDPQNPFAKILRGELPCFKLYEDEQTLAFMDIMPQSDGHALIIPKEAAVTILELSEASTMACIRVTRQIALAVHKALNCAGIQVIQANGPVAGQTVPHLHFHVIPRYEKTPLVMHAAKMGDPAKIKAHAEKIIAALQA
ncbi:MAG: histidine triad protein [Hydrocarboniphaga sp.]|uniref:HIT family protein n=1 Tax=Hydrocarboniphaga sp. TaxID=2033016 RepID=UPI00263199D8|nr:HIT domain-containing protein [Hydrocarboniphaga sp.]MDB5968842.1 histidine triad protein [Hydrocarboniphaga sp.]